MAVSHELMDFQALSGITIYSDMQVQLVFRMNIQPASQNWSVNGVLDVNVIKTTRVVLVPHYGPVRYDYVKGTIKQRFSFPFEQSQDATRSSCYVLYFRGQCTLDFIPTCIDKWTSTCPAGLRPR